MGQVVGKRPFFGNNMQRERRNLSCISTHNSTNLARLFILLDKFAIYNTPLRGMERARILPR